MTASFCHGEQLLHDSSSVTSADGYGMRADIYAIPFNTVDVPGVNQRTLITSDKSQRLQFLFQFTEGLTTGKLIVS